MILDAPFDKLNELNNAADEHAKYFFITSDNVINVIDTITNKIIFSFPFISNPEKAVDSVINLVREYEDKL